jgi:phospholipase C
VSRSLSVFSLAAILSFSLFLTACGGAGSKSSNNDQQQAPPPTSGKPTLDSFQANPTTISGDESTSNVTWTSSNATSVAITPMIGTVGTSGSLDVQPPDTTTFTAVANGPGGSSDPKTVTVTVARELTLLFQANPPVITPGQSTTLSWTSKGALSLTIDNNIGAQSSIASGSVNVSPTATTTYTATANGTNSQVISQQVTVTVQPVVATLNANPTCINSGSSATLSYFSQGATTISIDNGVGDQTPPSGSVSVTPSATTTYTVAAADASNHTATAQATVQVGNCGGINQVKHIIFLVQENRSFDNYFGKLGEYKTSRGFANDVDGFDPNEALPDLATPPNMIKSFHARTVCTELLTPGWNESHRDVHFSGSTNSYQANATPMEGFLKTTTSVAHQYDPTGERAMGYYDQTDLPYYYELATQYATSDRFFSPVLAPTIPNRMYLFTGTSFGFIRPDNPDHAPYAQKTIFRAMTEAGVSWRYYYQDNSSYLPEFADWATEQGKVRNIAEYYNILADPAADSKLPQVIFIERAANTGGALDEHPHSRWGVQSGAKRVKQIIDALMHSAAWNSSVFILTYDEAGGLYDHVPPISVPAPDSIPPNLRSTDLTGDFTVSGMRIPVIVVSPFAKPHYTSHVPMDSTAILKFIETRFGVPSLTNRDANANDMSDFFDFVSPPRVALPTLPEQPAYNPDLSWNDPGHAVCDRTLETDPNQP